MSDWNDAKYQPENINPLCMDLIPVTVKANDIINSWEQDLMYCPKEKIYIDDHGEFLAIITEWKFKSVDAMLVKSIINSNLKKFSGNNKITLAKMQKHLRWGFNRTLRALADLVETDYLYVDDSNSLFTSYKLNKDK